ncbi:uncharacterized protein ColSpa_09785 [Colletotrichum spaethianum]|uniref:ORC1/DEAH AAA+ ATPase domain-containing protein n=1 Tax=Colletotrichum spaethianum TaxID=700344 RepID=A0AA37UJG2_9PEZI|nr:uncharacterized protein ColSpa_09785 [Colletotrichum spaethianum]GKT49604.1 hypothetical protein ColSpa_09785 [Colletotrichum spaethianum]
MGKPVSDQLPGRRRHVSGGNTRIELAVLTGICGGVPSPEAKNEILLGDVIISKSIVQYDLGRQYPDEFARKDTVEDSLGRPDKEIRSLVATFETRQGRRDLQRRAGEILTEIQQKAADDENHRDCGCSESGGCETARNTSCEKLQCDKGRLVPRKRLMTERHGEGRLMQDLQVFVGRIGSGDTVMKSGVDRDRIASDHSIVAFEMEGAGVWDEIPCVIVKAVCDYADSHKNKKWQDYAAATAASTTKALLENYASTGLDRPKTPRAPNNYCRSGALDHLKRQFGHEQQQVTAKARSRIALHGLGGVGKTQIALAYVYWLKEARPDVSVFWVHASNAQRFREAYASIAEECDIPGRDDPTSDTLLLVKRWLEKGERGPWLLVVDNADDTHLFFQAPEASQTDTSTGGLDGEGTLGRYIPECRHGSVLITTRNKQTGSRLAPGKPATKIEKLTDDEADQLLRSMLEEPGRSISAADTSMLSSRLEHLPLALAQAAAFIQENEISIPQYIKLLDKSDTSLVNHLSQSFEAIGRDSSTPHALTATWIISFEQIEKHNTVASDILSLISFFDRQVIPVRFIEDYCRQQQTQDSENDTEETRPNIRVWMYTGWFKQTPESGSSINKEHMSSPSKLFKLYQKLIPTASMRVVTFAANIFRMLMLY